MSLRQKVKNLKPYEVVELMIAAIEEPIVILNFDYFRKVIDGVCYACAATNMLYKMYEFPDGLPDGLFEARAQSSEILGEKRDDIYFFEDAIDRLRMGNIEDYNLSASMLEMTILPEKELPILGNSCWRENINEYKAYVEQLKQGAL